MPRCLHPIAQTESSILLCASRVSKTVGQARAQILADKIESVPAAQVGLGPFVIGPYKVRPRASREFSNAESLGLFLQLYNLQRDEALLRPSVFVGYKILRKGEEIWAATETSDTIRQAGEQVSLKRLIPLAAFTPGLICCKWKFGTASPVRPFPAKPNFRLKLN
jgi:hypothetical protein